MELQYEDIKKELEQELRLANYIDSIFCNNVSVDLLQKTIDLINRQQAEIERLKGAVQEWVDGKCLSQKHLLMIEKLQNEIEQAKSKAIKEFAERFIDEECAYCSSESDEMIFFKERFDNFLAEMVGEQNV